MTGSGASTGQTSRSLAAALSPLWALLPHRTSKWWSRLSWPGDYLRLHPTQFTGAFSTIGHATKTGRKSHSTKYTETNTGRMLNWGDKEKWPKWKTEQNSRKRNKRNGDNKPIRCRVQNFGDQDAQRTDWVQQQHKWRNEGHTKWNKEKSIGNHQWKGGNQDSYQWFGT